jgi:hypothetical protein
MLKRAPNDSRNDLRCKAAVYNRPMTFGKVTCAGDGPCDLPALRHERAVGMNGGP